MTYFKNYILLFGGFQDTSQQTKYLQDLWIYDVQNFVWHNPTLPPASQKPDARSSFSFLPHESGAVIYGGYSRVKTNTAGKGKAVSKTSLQPLVHQDTWFLRITQPEQSGPLPPNVRWERRKKPANPPNPFRAGATMTYHKGRGIMFGGVHDVEESEEGIESEFFDTLFAWNTDRNRFFPLTLRRPRAAGKKQANSGQAYRGRNRGKADEEELLKNLAALETKGGIEIDNDQMEVDTIQREEEPEADQKASIPVRFEMPHPRFNAQLAVQDDTLFIFGGTVERGDQEFTFDDMYSIDLGKLDGVREIFYREPDKWNDGMEIESDEDEEDEDYSGDSEEEEGGSVDTMPTDSQLPAKETKDDEPAEMETEGETAAEKDGKPYPRPFESLREFFARTSNDWQNIILESLKYGGSQSSQESSIKELRKKAFEMAEERWWDCREDIRALEDEQEEAGIGEVVSIAERGANSSGAGRRR